MSIRALQERNIRVEADKAWETSRTRKAVIAVLTYISMVIFLYLAGIQKPWLNALVPSMAYILSTLTFPYIKNWWLRNVYGK